MVTSISANLLALLSILALSTSFTNQVQAHSSAWPTITRSELILNLRHDILPRIDSHPLAKRNIDQKVSTTFPNIISSHDTIRLQFSAFNTTFHLHLEPNLDLIHPDANLGPDIFHDDIKAFKGIVVQNEQHSDRKWQRAATTSRIAKRTVEHMLYEEGVLGWARMMVEHDADSTEGPIIRGAFMVNDDTYHVTTRQSYHIQKRSDDAFPTQTSTGTSLVIYRDSDLYKPAGSSRTKRDLTSNEVSCGADHLNKTAEYISATSSHDYYYPPDSSTTIPDMGGFKMSSSWTDMFKTSLVKRNVSVNVAGPSPVPQGCPVNRLVNYMGVAADCAYVQSYGGQVQARQQIFADFNTASGIYESTFNVALGVIALNITTENCPAVPVQGQEWNQDCSAAYTIDKRLSDFSNWRGQGGRANDGAGLWHLMTKCNSGPVVGIAWTKALCQMKSQAQGTQYTAGTGVSSITPNEWMVVAHEVGHGFGAIHDCTADLCPPTGGQCCPLSTTTCDAAGKYIMNPSEQIATRVFSPCSITAICGTIQSSGQCLQAPGTRQTQSTVDNICGNGIKETGEDCDCGTSTECASDPCCDGATCKFKGTAVCDDMNDGCCLNCQLRPSGYVCRQAISECDIPEVCAGTNATCPTDVKVADQTPCKGTGNTTGLQCANGVCTSRDLQCQQQDRPGITGQCGASNTCDLMCNDPSGNSLTCTQIPGAYFVDGSPCGFGGTCSGGSCAYSSGIKGVLNWARNHLTIVIPVACVIGLILICCIWSCCCSGFYQRRRQRKMVLKPSMQRPFNGAHAGAYSRSYGSNAVHNAQHSGQEYPMGPVPPPPAYHDPSALLRQREEEQLQRALEESRLEHERNSSALSGLGQQRDSPTPELQNSQRGASVTFTPLVNQSSELPSGHRNSDPFVDHTQSQYRPAGYI
ncbi:hypothetical protein BGZ46_005980 [Entomortierella lignicola]|nr:hypothetical protein BGZ46_005980 [Entomortierella lignicola]